MLSADTHVFLHAANPDSASHSHARNFLEISATAAGGFVVCELVLVELYMQLRDPAVLRKPLSASNAAKLCAALRSNPDWQHVDYTSDVSASLWAWAQSTKTGFRQIIDARLALTLKHHGVTEFATANLRDFRSFGFERIWNPLDP